MAASVVAQVASRLNEIMRHYCTYFDQGFLIQGLALQRSLAVHDPEGVLWVLALDAFTQQVIEERGDPRVRAVPLAMLEQCDRLLQAAKANRSRAEYFFTLSPCWPRWVLGTHPEIERVTYLDADLFFFSSPAPMFDAIQASGASITVTAHRFPAWLDHYRQHGVFNVGVLSFRNDAAGRACLDDWRTRCLEWCHDRVEGGKYADQGYLDQWPERWGKALQILDDPGVNLAPWNWAAHHCDVTHRPKCPPVQVEGHPLVIFHFARFRPLRGLRWWQSGQLDYGVMPFRLRNAIYGRYWRTLCEVRRELRAKFPDVDFPRRAVRHGRAFWRGLPLRVVFGGDWLRIGACFFNLRAGLGAASGRVLGALRGASKSG